MYLHSGFFPKTKVGPLPNKKLPSSTYGGEALLTCALGSALNTPDLADLTTSIRPALEDSRGVYTQALHILTLLQTSPSCNRIATSTLLASCQSIDGSKQDAEIEADDVKSIYAAQLAMCEIASAGSTTPHSCKSLAPPTRPKSSSQLSTKRYPKARIGECLQALESRPQWWTSYSNSRQNAVIMCQAARADIDKSGCPVDSGVYSADSFQMTS